MRVARLWPHPLAVGKREMLISSVGAGLGLMLAGWISHFILGEVNLWFIAPMGASAVLLFGVPNSPLAQPWSIVGGNALAATVGVSVGLLIPDPGLACGAAAAVAIGLMFKLRCLHPPGGAVALTAILGGPGIHQMGYHFVLYPVLLNSVLLRRWPFCSITWPGDATRTRWRRRRPSRPICRSMPLPSPAPICTRR
ncbi:putative transmembrane protein [Serratia marcescens]|nr:putative transmembrane protein [Serratia marcescens]